jgi:ribose transport system ATP-binding protein
MSGPSEPPLLELHGVGKRYGGVRALEDVEFACRAGSIHAVLGENGAGKSTLIKIVAGVVRPDSGTMRFEGREVAFKDPIAANRAGIVCVFQELSLVPDLSVADNIALSEPPTRFGMIDRRAQRRQARALLEQVGCADIHPDERVRNLSLSRRQMVEIAKALGKRPRLLILDEATSALTGGDVERVFAILRRLRQEGLAILYISHRMHEIAALADTCSVFRNGRHVETFEAGTKTGGEIVGLMIGRELRQVFPPKPVRAAPPDLVLDVERLGWAGRLHDLSFTVGRGEVVGLGGLDGQGQRELLLALFGVLRGVEGRVAVEGRAVRVSGPDRAKAAPLRMALIPEDRKTEGLMLPMSVRDNLGMAALGRLARFGMIEPALEEAAVGRAVDQLRIKVGNVDDAVGTLSGGNQQKVVLGKWLMTEPGIVLLNDPTRGIDVGTKQEFYVLLRELADAGASLLFYSTDYDELIGCCDRVLILYDGRIVRTLESEALTEENIVASSLNIDMAADRAA